MGNTGASGLVSIVATSSFVGFVIQAQRTGPQKVVGKFKNVPPGISAVDCDGTNDTLYAWFRSERPARNMTFTWIPPDTDQGTISFIGTVYKDEATFWTNLQSKRLRKGFAAIDLDTCNTKKACFRYTRTGESSCNQETCVYLVTSWVKDSEAHFEMSAKADWAAIGFSSDDKMGGDDVFMCMRTRASGEVRHFWNDYAHQAPHLQEINPLYNREVEVTEDGRIACRFSRLLKVSNGNQFNIDLNNDWFQLYAWGPLSQSGTLMRHTLENPPVSATKMTLLRKRNVIAGANALSTSGTTLLFSLSLLWIILRYLRPST